MNTNDDASGPLVRRVAEICYAIILIIITIATITSILITKLHHID
jgi:hypothetical protein